MMTLLPVLYRTSGFGKHDVGGEQKRFATPVVIILRLLENS
jgi:hypothetical protein